MDGGLLSATNICLLFRHIGPKTVFKTWVKALQLYYDASDVIIVVVWCVVNT